MASFFLRKIDCDSFQIGFISFFLLLPGLSVGQGDYGLTHHYGKLQKTRSKNLHEQIITGDTNGIYVLRAKYTTFGESYFYWIFFANGDYDLKATAELISKNSYKGTSARFKTYFEDLYPVGDRLVLFLSSYDHEKDRHYAYAQYLDDAGVPDSDLKLISEIKSRTKVKPGFL